MAAGGVTEFRIIIEGEDVGKDSNSSNPIFESNNPNPKVAVAKSASKLAGYAIIGNTVKTVTSYAINNVGTYTGNTVMQNKVNAGMQMASYGMQIAVNPIAGSISMLTDLILKQIEYDRKKKEDSIGVAQARERAGVNLYRGRF